MCYSCCQTVKDVPSTDCKRVIIPPLTGTTECFAGIYNAYSERYPQELANYMTESEFNLAIGNINDTLLAYWPCCFCFNFGYLCCLPTLGLSLFVPYQCADGARQKAVAEMSTLNAKFSSRGLEWRFVRHGNTVSWLEVWLPGNKPSGQPQSDKTPLLS